MAEIAGHLAFYPDKVKIEEVALTGSVPRICAVAKAGDHGALLNWVPGCNIDANSLPGGRT